jgi:hypothetical protein
MALLSGHLPGIEQAELDPAGNSGDAGLTGLAGREVAGLLGLPRAGAVRAVAGKEARQENLQQEGGEGEVCLVRGKAAMVSVAAARACGKLIWSGGMPAAVTAMRTIVQMAW